MTDASDTAAADDRAATDTERQRDTPDPQSADLRRQQRYVGIGGGLLAGFAVATVLVQRLPDVSPVLPVLAGALAAGTVLWLASRSVFPGDQ